MARMGMEAHAAATLGFLEAAYAWERDDAAWFQGVLAAGVKVWGRPHWACAYEYDVSDPSQIHIGKPLFWGASRSVQQIMGERIAIRGAAPEVVYLYRTVSLGFAKPVGGVDDVDRQVLSDAGTSDYFVINGLDGSGRGCAIGLGAERNELRPDEILVLQHLAAHLSSAYRCRTRLRRARALAVEDAEAIVRVDGRVVEARGPAQHATAREALHEAARSMSRVRRRKSKDLPTEHWRPRVRTRWTLVDSPGRDREQYLLARENQIQPGGLELLTDRERQVVASVAAGRTTKEIAYELGISDATARVLLARAYARLGVKSREELFTLKSIRGLRGELPD